MADNNGKIRVAFAQTARERFDKAKNIQNAERMLDGIRDVDMVCFPENWAGAVVLEEEETGDLLLMVSEHARRIGCTALTGSLFMRRDTEIIAAGHVIDAAGNVVGHTEKIFPSLPVGERGFVTPGDYLPLFDVGGVRFGVVVCVDLFYPELSRSLALRGAQILFNPSNIPTNRIPLWRSLVSARAAENTVYAAFLNNTRTTYPDERDVTGHSMLAAPWGDILFEAGEDDGVSIVEIDLAQPEEVRKRWPYLADIECIERFDGEQIVRKPAGK